MQFLPLGRQYSQCSGGMWHCTAPGAPAVGCRPQPAAAACLHPALRSGDTCPCAYPRVARSGGTPPPPPRQASQAVSVPQPTPAPGAPFTLALDPVSAPLPPSPQGPQSAPPPPKKNAPSLNRLPCWRGGEGVVLTHTVLPKSCFLLPPMTRAVAQT